MPLHSLPNKGGAAPADGEGQCQCGSQEAQHTGQQEVIVAGTRSPTESGLGRAEGDDVTCTGGRCCRAPRPCSCAGQTGHARPAASSTSATRTGSPGRLVGVVGGRSVGRSEWSWLSSEYGSSDEIVGECRRAGDRASTAVREPLHWLMVTGSAVAAPVTSHCTRVLAPPPLAEPLHCVTVAFVVSPRVRRRRSAGYPRRPRNRRID